MIDSLLCLYIYFQKITAYPYQLEYHRAKKTAPYTTNGGNNHSTKVHKNSYKRLVRYTIPASGHPNPITEITVSFYNQLLQNGRFHPDGK